MSRNDNHSRAQKIVDSWPSWKKEVSLTKYSTASPKSCLSGEQSQKVSNSEQSAEKISA